MKSCERCRRICFSSTASTYPLGRSRLPIHLLLALLMRSLFVRISGDEFEACMRADSYILPAQNMSVAQRQCAQDEWLQSWSCLVRGIGVLVTTWCPGISLSFGPALISKSLSAVRTRLETRPWTSRHIHITAHPELYTVGVGSRVMALRPMSEFHM